MARPLSSQERAAEPSTEEGSSASLSFEAAYAELQQVIHELESGMSGLEASVRLFERGMELAALCEQIVALAEQRVTRLAAGEPEITAAGAF